MPARARFFLSLFLLFIISQLVFITNTQFAVAKADELVLKDTGEIILIVPDSGVLAVSTSTSNNKPASNPPSSNTNSNNQSKPASPPQTTAPSSAPKTKSESLTPQNTKATININPQPTTDNKIKVTITPQNKPATTTKAASSPQVSTTSSPNPQPSITPSPTTTAETKNVDNSTPPPPITKLVDRVSEQGADGSTILSVQPGDNKITFQQGQTEVSTTLPIQIDSQTHQLSTISLNGPEKISILPNEAVAGATNLGIISKQQNTAAPKVTLTEVDNQVVYKIEGEKTGKLLGIFNISSNVEVDISAQNGTPVKTSQPLLIRAFGFLIK